MTFAGTLFQAVPSPWPHLDFWTVERASPKPGPVRPGLLEHWRRRQRGQPSSRRRHVRHLRVQAQLSWEDLKIPSEQANCHSCRVHGTAGESWLMKKKYRRYTMTWHFRKVIPQWKNDDVWVCQSTDYFQGKLGPVKKNLWRAQRSESNKDLVTGVKDLTSSGESWCSSKTKKFKLCWATMFCSKRKQATQIQPFLQFVCNSLHVIVLIICLPLLCMNFNTYWMH